MRYGKWIGGALGWALGGPIGGILGFAFGTIFDDKSLSVEEKSSSRRTYRRHKTAAGDFAASLLVLSAAIMKADGKILKSELNYVREFYERQFGKEVAGQQMLILRDLLKKEIPLKEVSEQIRYFMEHSARLQLIHYLFGIANADKQVDTSEVNTIHRIAQYMGISEKDYASIKAMFYKDATSAYKILEITESANDDEVKKAYRKMAKKYHPDKVRDLGEAHQKAAQEKFLKVQDAYDTIKKKEALNKGNMFGDMMNKLQEMQAEVEKSKKRLDSITVEAEAQGVKVIMNGNRKVTGIEISEELLDDKEAVEELILTAFNRSLEKADKVNEAEMAGAAKGIIPNMPFGK